MSKVSGVSPRCYDSMGELAMVEDWFGSVDEFLSSDLLGKAPSDNVVALADWKARKSK